MQHIKAIRSDNYLSHREKQPRNHNVQCSINSLVISAGRYNGAMDSPATIPPVQTRILDWVAMIDRLTPDDRAGLRAHFLSLDASDRRLRFGGAVADDYLGRYVDGIDFATSWVYGVRDGRGGWVGVGHLSPAQGAPEQRGSAELGLSVVPSARGRGLGAAIFRFAVAQASRDGAERLYMHCLTSNRAILSIARSAGMAIGSSGGEADAWLQIPPQAELIRLLIEEPAAA